MVVIVVIIVVAIITILRECGKLELESKMLKKLKTLDFFLFSLSNVGCAHMIEAGVRE